MEYRDEGEKEEARVGRGEGDCEDGLVIGTDEVCVCVNDSGEMLLLMSSDSLISKGSARKRSSWGKRVRQLLMSMIGPSAKKEEKDVDDDLKFVTK